VFSCGLCLAGYSGKSLSVLAFWARQGGRSIHGGESGDHGNLHYLLRARPRACAGLLSLPSRAAKSGEHYFSV
jgi:hypothetical protein